MITYKKMSLFEAPKNSYLVQSCNTQGVWEHCGSEAFKVRFPHAFAVYNRSCQGNSKFALGKSWSIWDGDYRVTCLMTSEGHGKDKSSKADILKHTEMAVDSFLSYVQEWDKERMPIYSYKPNLEFSLTWEETEVIIDTLTDLYDIPWIVCV